MAGVQLDAVEARRAGTRRGGVDEPVDDPGQVVVGGHLHRVRGGRRRERRHHRRRLLRRDHARERVGRGRPLLRRHEQRPALGDVEQALGAVVHELGGDRGAVAVGVVGQAPQPGEVRVVGRRDLARVGARHRVGDGDRPDDHAGRRRRAPAPRTRRPGRRRRCRRARRGSCPSGSARCGCGSSSDPRRPGDSSRSNAAHHSWSV